MLPPSRKTRLSAPLAALLIAALAAPTPFSSAQAQPRGGPVDVGVITVALEDAPIVTTLAGRAVAYESVDIRPRVGGVVGEISYAAGRRIEVNDLLFKIEDDSYAAEVESAEAEVASAEASLADAEATLNRYQRLENTAVTAADVQTAEADVAKARAAVRVAQATLRVARLNLERTEVRSPIAGYPSVPNVSVGDIVTSNQTDALTTITRLDPIYIDVEESSARILRLRQQIASGALRPGARLEMRLILENDAEYDSLGEIVAPGRTVSTTTGVTEFRVQFDNPERLIMPGQFLRVEATIGTMRAFLVPQRATSRSGGGALTAYVVREGRAVQVTLTDNGVYNNAWIVTNGLEEGDLLIIDNLRSVSDGVAVSTTPVRLTEEGLVVDAASEIDAAPAAAAPTETETVGQ